MAGRRSFRRQHHLRHRGGAQRAGSEDRLAPRALRAPSRGSWSPSAWGEADHGAAARLPVHGSDPVRIDRVDTPILRKFGSRVSRLADPSCAHIWAEGCAGRAMSRQRQLPLRPGIIPQQPTGGAVISRQAARAGVVPRLLRENPDFQRLWAGLSISQLGDQISLIALPLVAVLALDASAAQMGYLAAAGLAPNLLFALHAGALADRFGRRRKLMITADLGRAVLIGSIPAAYAVDQ